MNGARCFAPDYLWGKFTSLAQLGFSPSKSSALLASVRPRTGLVSPYNSSCFESEGDDVVKRAVNRSLSEPPSSAPPRSWAAPSSWDLFQAHSLPEHREEAARNEGQLPSFE